MFEITEMIEAQLAGKLPELKTSKIKTDKSTRYIPKFASRQTVEIPKERFADIYKMLPESLRKKARKYRVEYKEEIGGYDSTEFYGKYDALSSSLEDAARLFFKKADRLMLSVYSAEKAKSLPAFIDVITEFHIPEYNVEIPDECTLSETEKSYNIVNGDIYCLTLNLPYEYYKDIDLPDFTACYDICRNALWFTGGDLNEHIETIKSVAENGFTKHIFLKIDGGVVVSAKDYYWAILIAKELKLPTIPVCLYVTTEETSCFERFVDKKIKDKSLINELCAPYFTF